MKPVNNQKFKLYSLVDVRPYTQKDLRFMYKVSRKTMFTWLEGLKDELGERKGRSYSIAQVLIIFDNLGVPELAVRA